MSKLYFSVMWGPDQSLAVVGTVLKMSWNEKKRILWISRTWDSQFPCAAWRDSLREIKKFSSGSA